MHRSALVVVSFFAILLTACETRGPDRVDASRPTVSYEYDDDEDLAEAQEKADEYCEEYGQDARLRDTDERDGENIAVFDCR